MRTWPALPRSAKIKATGYTVSTVSVILLAIVAWRSASRDPLLAICLFGGAMTSIAGMCLRFWSFEVENDEMNE